MVRISKEPFLFEFASRLRDLQLPVTIKTVLVTLKVNTDTAASCATR